MLTKAYAEEQAKKEINKKIKQWKLCIRQQAGNKCEVCGITGLLHPHHILVKERYPEFKIDVMNGILLCPLHHKYGKLSAHMNAIWFSQWLHINHPWKYKWALDNIGQDKEKMNDGNIIMQQEKNGYMLQP